MITFLAHAHVLDATPLAVCLGGVGDGMITFLAHADILNATPLAVRS